MKCDKCDGEFDYPAYELVTVTKCKDGSFFLGPFQPGAIAMDPRDSHNMDVALPVCPLCLTRISSPVRMMDV